MLPLLINSKKKLNINDLFGWIILINSIYTIVEREKERETINKYKVNLLTININGEEEEEEKACLN